MRLANRRCGSLPVMANYAPEFIQCMGYRRMWSEWLRALVCEDIFLERDMAGCAAIYNVLFRDPDLLNARLKSFLQPCRLWPLRDQLAITALVLPPLAEKVPCRRN
jgi:hypothetical protein